MDFYQLKELIFQIRTTCLTEARSGSMHKTTVSNNTNKLLRHSFSLMAKICKIF